MNSHSNEGAAAREVAHTHTHARTRAQPASHIFTGQITSATRPHNRQSPVVIVVLSDSNSPRSADYLSLTTTTMVEAADNCVRFVIEKRRDASPQFKAERVICRPSCLT